MTRFARVLLLVTMLAAAPAGAAAPDFSTLALDPYEPPKPAPSFALPDLDQRIARLEDYRGKTLLLFFWATW
jgi:cytochrome oxidase Cu insertion factor (SCO1/SenC/PrrC family)